MKLKKIIALLLVTVLLSFTLLSCGRSKAERILAKADKASADDGSFIVVYDYDFTYSDSEISELFYVMNYSTAEMHIQDDKIYTETHTEIPVGATGKVQLTVKQTFLDNTVYVYQRVNNRSNPSNSSSSIEKSKVNLTDEQKAELLGTSGNSIEVEEASFINASMEKTEDGKYVISCSEFSEEFITSLTDSITSTLKDDYKKAETSLDRGVIDIVISDGKYESATIYAFFSIKLKPKDEKTYSLCTKIDMSFDFESPVSIEGPDDSNKYTTRTYNQVFN